MSGNSFGKLFTVTGFGESHGPALGCIVDGCPPGLELSAADLQGELDRRKPGKSRHTTQRREADEVQILSGVFEGKTTGAPIGLIIHNTDQRSKDYSKIMDRFRPGHADYSYQQKYGIRDYRGGGRSSARETAMRVAAGAIAKKYLQLRYGIEVHGYLAQLGPIRLELKDWSAVEDNPFFSPDPARVPELEAYMDALRKEGDSVGARVNVVATGVPPGLGEPIFDRLDADIAHALMSINAVKGVEIGAGFECVAQKGTEHRDEMTPAGISQQSCRWYPRWHLQWPGHPCQHCTQAHFEYPHPGTNSRHRWPACGSSDDRTTRPLCRHPRHAHRGSHAGDRADGPHAASSCTEYGCRLRNPDDPGRASGLISAVPRQHARL